MSNKVALRQAIKLIGSQAKLATILRVSRQRVNHWLNRDDNIPYRYALAIEKATDGMVAHQELLLAQYEAPTKQTAILPVTLEYLAHQQIGLQQEMGDVSKKVSHILSLLQADGNADK
jgi:DNA-binding transcriptional regulator YdaS (Cro superfamily)